jgi:hypothetical protein
MNMLTTKRKAPFTTTIDQSNNKGKKNSKQIIPISPMKIINNLLSIVDKYHINELVFKRNSFSCYWYFQEKKKTK